MKADAVIKDAVRDAEEFLPQNSEESPLESFSDDAIALRFAVRHAPALRFVAKWGQWLRHNGAQWQPDDTLHARDLARDVCRLAAAEAGPRTAVKIKSSKTIPPWNRWREQIGDSRRLPISGTSTRGY
jgi:hypothetical protein